MAITGRQVTKSITARGKDLADDRKAHFALLYLLSEFPSVGEERLATQVAFDPSSTGLNAFHIDRESRNLILYICRWSTSWEDFVAPLTALLASGLDTLFPIDSVDTDPL